MSVTKAPFTSFTDAAQHYPFPYIYRSRQDQLDLIGCPYSPKTLANLDSDGRGCKSAVKIAGKVIYPPAAFAEWLDEITGNTSNDDGGK